MWRVILVDDEEFVRAELAALFPWRRYQFELAGEAESAQAAIAQIAALQPDLVITDIRMPEMDGLAFISWLGRHHPRLVVAVVSAYHDFPLVREALRLGAADYLMKAEATATTAGAFLERIAGILERRHSSRHQQEELTSNMARYHRLATESFWRDTLTRASDEPELESRARQLGVVLEQAWFGLIFIHVSGERSGRLDPVALRRELEAQIGTRWDWEGNWKLIDFGRGDFAVLASRMGPRPAAEAAAKLQEIAGRLALNTAEVKRTTCASSELCPFPDLPRSFREVRQVNLLRLYHREGECIETGELARLRQAAPPSTLELLAAWERILREAEPAAVHHFLDQVFAAILPRSLSPEAARGLVLEFINTLRRVSLEYQVRWEEGGSGEPDLPEILEQAESIQDWRIQIEDRVGHYLRSVGANAHPQASATIRKALAYIQLHFSRDLSLEEVASHAGVSKSYLCRVFPEYAGEHFRDYLQRLRLERAKELLRFTNDHIYEIAAKVGFWNSRYFSKVFHEAVGMTPADYRRVPVYETSAAPGLKAGEE
ncbi:YesN/AraC family two-component response regulator [Hydrogenispora ethanolica]|uniref:YesN/AraC family two-component response regulator n=1 Tax=Hydrogenispora ethanolica TaxID=1082276 RepID=A0A4V2QGS5_HYDET|nr:helix-turn-helix domain-containing protein [Hydrogenispora ethanolica]TCL77007.1 YesN/AraC family two-component response regulator [Hydrogenispora ethanolica]